MKRETVDRLTEICNNIWWSWTPEAVALFEEVNPTAFRVSGNSPRVALRSARSSVLEDPDFQERTADVHRRFRRYLEDVPSTNAPRVSYFCMEYGLHESLPLYAGGLGVLAGDHLKAASDLGIPFTAIGLFLREGYFMQHFDEHGWQHQSHSLLNPEDHPLELVTDDASEPVIVEVHIGDQPLKLRAWKLQVGRAPLYLLDSGVDENPEHLRPLTYRLYQGGTRARIQKEIVVGIGGVRLLRAIGRETDVYHQNEGHCAFLTLELLRERLEAGGSREEAESWVRSHCVFTTHTPVAAGHDRFDVQLFSEHMGYYGSTLGMSLEELMAYGRIRPAEAEEPFNMTVLALKMSRKSNGVSKLHGEVSRRMWNELWLDQAVKEIPIDHVTNGVHLPTWTSRSASDFLERHLGAWRSSQMNSEFWQRIHDVPDEELWEYRNRLRLNLIHFVNARLQRQSLPQVSRLHPDALTIGFARRFATYKRAPLLFSNEEEAVRLFTQHDRPIQIVYAGKAHPADEGGKSFIQRIFQMAQHPALKGRVLLLENYDIEAGRALVAGCDVWLNNPRRPMEASGTSGQKVTLHAGLNVSILDGWWPEGYNGENGWAIGHDASPDVKNPWEQDEEDAHFLYQVFLNEVIPAFFERDERGVPEAWVRRIKNAMATLPAVFNTERMVREYLQDAYLNGDFRPVAGRRMKVVG